jgi:DNA-directed RNA polymerase alpha subunit
LRDVGVPPRVFRALRTLGAKSLRDAAALSPEHLLDLPNFGESSLAWLNARLGEFELRVGKLPAAESTAPAAVDLSAESTIAEAGFSARLRNALQRLGVKTVDQAALVSSETLAEQPNVGVKTVDELRTRLAGFGMKMPGDLLSAPNLVAQDASTLLRAPLNTVGLSRRLIVALERLGVGCLEDATRIARERLLAEPNIGSGTVEELERRLASAGRSLLVTPRIVELPRHTPSSIVVSPLDPNATIDDLATTLWSRGGRARELDVMTKLLGWGGAGPRTLEAVAGEFDVSRERIRQIADRALETLTTRSVVFDRIKSALRVLRELAPCRERHADEAIRERGLVGPQMRARDVVELADRMGLEHYLVSVGDVERGLLLHRAQAEVAKLTSSRARRMSDHWGAVAVDDLAEDCSDQLGRSIESGLVRMVLEALSEVEWLDETRQWFWLGSSSRNRVVSRVRKMLTVAERLSLGELRDGIARDYRMKGFTPPMRVLREICHRLEICDVNGTLVSRRGTLPRTTLSPAEQQLVHLLEQHGGCLGRRALERAAAELGMGSPLLWQRLTYSCVLTKPAPGVFAIRGAELLPAQIDAASEIVTPKRRTVDVGWTPSGVPWCAIELSYAAARTGILFVPAAVRKFVTGEYDIVLRDGRRAGRLRVRDSSAWGLQPAIARRGFEEGDIVILEWDVKRHLVLVVRADVDSLTAYREGTANFWPDLSEADESHGNLT